MPLVSSNCICSSEVASGSVMHLTKYPFSQWITGFLCFQLVTNVLCNACSAKLWKILHTSWIKMANLKLIQPGADCPLYAPHLGNAVHFSINCCQVTLFSLCSQWREGDTSFTHLDLLLTVDSTQTSWFWRAHLDFGFFSWSHESQYYRKPFLFGPSSNFKYVRRQDLIVILAEASWEFFLPL